MNDNKLCCKCKKVEQSLEHALLCFKKEFAETKIKVGRWNKLWKMKPPIENDPIYQLLGDYDKSLYKINQEK